MLLLGHVSSSASPFVTNGAPHLRNFVPSLYCLFRISQAFALCLDHEVVGRDALSLSKSVFACGIGPLKQGSFEQQYHFFSTTRQQPETNPDKSGLSQTWSLFDILLLHDFEGESVFMACAAVVVHTPHFIPYQNCGSGLRRVCWHRLTGRGGERG